MEGGVASVIVSYVGSIRLKGISIMKQYSEGAVNNMKNGIEKIARMVGWPKRIR